MKMMKKLFAMLLVLCMVFSLCACGGNGDSKEDGKNNNVVNNDVNKDDSEDESKEDENVQTQPSFKVKIVDQDGNPVPGAAVQVCKDICTPGLSDAEGVATISVTIEDGHKLQVLNCPEGYVYEGDAEIYLEAGQTEYTLSLKKAVE